MIHKPKIHPKTSVNNPTLHAQQHAVLFRQNRNPYRKGTTSWTEYERASEAALLCLEDLVYPDDYF